MKDSNNWKIEHQEDQDYIITGFGLQHPGVFNKREAKMILGVLKLVRPLIQKATIKSYLAELEKENELTSSQFQDFGGQFIFFVYTRAFCNMYILP